MPGTIKLFKFAGIQVYLHFTWFIFAVYEFTQRIGAYHSPIWSALEYLSLFGIVLLHEFGHALACRQTGGRADQIVLWPLGGVAFVNPPRRPGAVLWSIAAGPLVNVLLVPILWLAASAVPVSSPDLYVWIRNVFFINGLLLVFNMFPVYPLDGGQILWALLWFPLGEIRSLQIASVIGFVGAIVLAACALIFQLMQPFWVALMALFLISRAIAGWQQAKAMVAERDALQSPPIVPQV